MRLNNAWWGARSRSTHLPFFTRLHTRLREPAVMKYRPSAPSVSALSAVPRGQRPAKRGGRRSARRRSRGGRAECEQSRFPGGGRRLCPAARLRNVLSVRCQDSAAKAGNETISYAAFAQAIERPLRAFLAAHAKIDFIVLTRGTPIRIADAPGAAWAIAAPRWTAIWPRWTTRRRPAPSSCTSSTADSAAPPGRTGSGRVPRRFRTRQFGGWRVARLDGYTEADAKALTTRALAAERRAEGPAAGGKVLLDACPAFGFADRTRQPCPIFPSPPAAGKQPTVVELNYNEYNADMQLAADILLRGACRSN